MTTNAPQTAQGREQASASRPPKAEDRAWSGGLHDRGEAVCITGIGALGPQGAGYRSIEALIDQPRHCFSPRPADWPEWRGVPDAWVAALDPSAWERASPHDSLSTDRACALALAASDEAWTQAAVSAMPGRSGVFWGTGMGGLHSTETSYQRLLLDGQALRPMTVVRIMGNSAAAQIATRFGLRGPNMTYTVACASSAIALGEAMLAIRSGRVDVAIAGGSEAMLLPGVLAAWGALRVLSTRQTVSDVAMACRPFGAGRSGLVIGEGAAAFVLESAAHARNRGATPLAWLSGYGQSCDAASLVHPQIDGQLDAMRAAIADAGLSTSDIGSVNVHATGTDAGDLVEAQALSELFGADPIPPVCASKSMHGHLLGAAGAIEAAICVASLARQLVPATPGHLPLDPRCAAVPISTTARSHPMRHILSNSFAFGGTNAALVLSSDQTG